MNQTDVVNETFGDFTKKTPNFFQVDLLKSFMITFVIIDHAFAYTSRLGFGFQLWERMAIPVFLIIMGFNMGNSFAKVGEVHLKELYSWDYFKKKLWRFVFPYFIFYSISTTIGFILFGAMFPDTFSENWILDYIIFQKTLLEGPGIWFIPIIFQSILLLPLLYKLFSKMPKTTLILCFVIEICMHLISFFFVGPLTSMEAFQKEVLFRQTIFFYVFAIALGMWFSRKRELFSLKNLFVWISFPICLFYMVAWDFFGFRLKIDNNLLVRGDYNFFTFIYSALIILLILRLIPKNPKNKIAKVFTAIGKSTFHIYLVQDLTFIILYVNYNSIWTDPNFSGIVNVLGDTADNFITIAGLMIINWLIIISCGVIWWYVEKRFRLFVINRKN